MGAYAFNGCTGLTNIILNEGITTIGTYAFPSAAVTSLNIPESVTKIEGYAFANTSQLTDIKLPSNIKNIGYMAFGGVYTWDKNKLERVIYKNTEYLGSSALFGAFTENGVTYSSNCFQNSPFVD